MRENINLYFGAEPPRCPAWRKRNGKRGRTTARAREWTEEAMKEGAFLKQKLTKFLNYQMKLGRTFVQVYSEIQSRLPMKNAVT